MDTVTLQVPIKKSLRDRAATHFLGQGFSSLQEAIRVFITQAADKQIKVSFEQPMVLLTPKAAKRYDRMINEIDSGKVKTYQARNVDELMNHLHGN